MKALLLQTLRINGKRFVPSEGKNVVVDVADDAFNGLVDHGVVRPLTRDEAKLAALAEEDPPKAPRGKKAAETKADGTTPPVDL